MAHVLVLTSSYPLAPGDPAGHFVQAEARELADRGHRVTVLVPASSSRVWDDQRKGARGSVLVQTVRAGTLFGTPGAIARVKEAPWKIAFAFSSTWNMRRAAAQWGPIDRIIAHWLLPSALPWSSWLHPNIPRQYVAHGSDVELLLRLPKGARNWILQRLHAPGAHLRFVSEELKSALLRGSLPRHLIHWIQEAEVSPAHLDLAGAPRRREARQALGLPPDERHAIVVARLIATKRTDVALQAAALVPDLRVTVLGDGPERQRLEILFPEVRFLGQIPRPQALTWIAAADLVLSASRKEGAPTVVREARALQTPVVSVTVGDLPAWQKTDPGLFLVS